MQNTIIYLLGLPGTGKYTIGKEIAARTGARLVDNHLINNPIFSLVRVDGKTKLPAKTWDYTHKILDVVLEAIIDLASQEQSFVFTNFLMENDAVCTGIFEQISGVASQREACFIPVRLLCDLPELQRRIMSEDRNVRMKMMDAEGIADDYRKYTVLNPDHPFRLELDVTDLSAEDAAEAILAHVVRCQG